MSASSSPLGQILVRRGVLSVEELQEALRLKESQGGSLAINLVIAGAVDDHTLANFYRERYKIESLNEKDLAGADRAVFSLIPDDIIYDTGILPLWREPAEFDDEEDALIVGVIDPSETQPLEEAAFFCPLKLVPRLLTIGQMARHYQRLSGRAWKISWEKVSQRRHGDPRRPQAKPGAAPPEEVAQVAELLEQAQALDASIDAVLANEDGRGLQGATVQFISVDGAEVLEEEIVELTQIKRQPSTGPEVNSVVIDTTVMSTAEAEAKLDELVAASVSQHRARKRPSAASGDASAAQPPPHADAAPETRSAPALARRSLKGLAERDPAPATQPDESLRKTLQLEVMARPSEPVTQPLEPVTQSLEPVTQSLEPVTQSLEAVSRPVDVVVLEQPKAPASLEEQTDLAWFSDEFDAASSSFENFFSSLVESSPSQKDEAPQADEARSALAAPVAADEAPAGFASAASVDDDEPPRGAASPPQAGARASSQGPPQEASEAAEGGLGLESGSPPQGAPASSQAPSPTPPPGSERPMASSVSVEGLTFTLTEDDRSGAVDNDLAIARRKLSECSDRDEVGQLLLRFLSQRYKRVLLMSVRQGELGCWQGWNGESKVKRGAVSFALSALPCFELAMSQRVSYLGPLTTGAEPDAAATAEAVRGLTRVWGGGAPLSLVACPLTLRDRAVLLMVYDDGPGDAVSLERRFLATIKHEAEQALERAILKRKRQVIRK